MKLTTQPEFWGIASFVGVLAIGVALPMWTINTIVITHAASYSDEENVPLWSAVPQYIDDDIIFRWDVWGHWSTIKLASTLIVAGAVGLGVYWAKKRRYMTLVESDYADGPFGALTDGRIGFNSASPPRAGS